MNLIYSFSSSSSYFAPLSMWEDKRQKKVSSLSQSLKANESTSKARMKEEEREK